MIQIPAGDTLLEWKYNSYIYVWFRYNFQPQKQYFFFLDQEEGKYGYRLYTYDFGEKVPGDPYRKDHLLGFVPFLKVSGI
jgi:hypothetical protein